MFNHINTSAVGGSAIRFFNSQQINTVHCNQMDTCRIGVRFDASNIGDQGSAAAAQENTWYFPPTPVGAYYAFNRDVMSSNRTWHYRFNSFNIPYHPIATQMFPTGFVIPGNGNATNDCEVPCPGCPNQRMADIVTEQNEFANLSADELYLLKHSVYQQLSGDNSSMYAGYPSDLILQNFYDSASQTNLGMLTMVNNLISDSLTLFANVINTWISPINHFEVNAKIINEIYINTWAVEIFTFNQAQMAALTLIASENPMSGGDAVYTARVMLGWDLIDFGYSSIRQFNIALKDRSKVSFELYPNPANKYINISAQHDTDELMNVVLIDVTGQIKLLSQFYDQDKIDISHLSNGIYLLKLYIGDKYSISKKVIIYK